jgi:hypothetical protein
MNTFVDYIVQEKGETIKKIGNIGSIADEFEAISDKYNTFTARPEINALVMAGNLDNFMIEFVKLKIGTPTPKPTVCKFRKGDNVEVNGKIIIAPSLGSSGKEETVKSEYGVIENIFKGTLKGTVKEICVYAIKFSDKRFGIEVSEDKLTPYDKAEEFYVSGDIDINLFKVAVYRTVNGRDQFVGQSTCSRNDTIKSVLNAFKQVCMRCLVSSGQMFVTSLDPKDLYVSFSNLNLKYDQVSLYLL